MRIGYGRVSTLDQHPEAQHDALIEAGCDPEHLFIEKASTRMEKRPQLEAALAYARPGDTLVITKLDRLGRSTRDLIDLVENRIKALGLELEAIQQNIDTTTPGGRAFYKMIAVFAEFERDMISERTRDGLAAARARGRVGGAKAKLSPVQAAEVRKLYGEGRRPREIMELFGISRATLYRYIGTEAEQAAGTPR